MAQAVARVERDYLLLEVAAFFDRDHTAVMNAVSNVEWFMQHPKTATLLLQVYEAAKPPPSSIQTTLQNLIPCQT